MDALMGPDVIGLQFGGKGGPIHFFAQSTPQLAYVFATKICPRCTPADKVTWSDLQSDRVELCKECQEKQSDTES